MEGSMIAVRTSGLNIAQRMEISNALHVFNILYEWRLRLVCSGFSSARELSF